MYEDIKDIVFAGYLEQNITINNHVLTLRTLPTDLEKQIIKKSKTNLLVIIKTLAKAIVQVDSEQVAVKMEHIESLPTELIKKIYNIYKALLERSYEIINKDFKAFYKTTESLQRFSALQHGYKLNGVLTPIQSAWINACSQYLENEKYKRQFDLCKYMVNHITAASINPKAYSQHIRKQPQQSDDPEFSQDTQQDYNKDIFEQLQRKNGETKEEADKRVFEYMQDRLNNQDDHDKLILEATTERFKALVRKRKVASLLRRSKPTTRVSKTGKEITVLTNPEVEKANANNPHVFNKVNYEDICKSKNFVDIPNKLQIIKEIVEEQDSWQYIKPEKKEDDSANSNIKAKKSKKGTTLRDLLTKKGVDLKEAQNLTLGDLNGKDRS